MTTLLHDLAHTLRSLRARLGFALAVVATLGVALAMSGTVAAVADRVLLRSLPLDDPSRLVLVFEAGRGEDRRLPSYPTFLDWQRDARASAQVAGLGYLRGNRTWWRTRDGVEGVTTSYVSPGFLNVLGARPRLGRGFTAEEEAPGRGDVVILSDALWRRAFGGDPGAVGRTMVLDDRTVTVVGVLAPGASYPTFTEMYRPISAVVDRDPALASRHFHSDGRTIARLRAGATVASAAAELSTIERRLSTAVPEIGAEWTRAFVQPLRDEIVGETAAPLTALGGAVALVLLVASANVATLLLLRAFARERELAIRAALGASRRRVAGLVALEGIALGTLALAVALPLTAVALGLLRRVSPFTLPRATELTLDARTALVVTLLASAATTLAAAPAVVRVLRGGRAGATRASAVEALRAGWQATAGGRAARRVRGTLAVVQLALALALLAGAGLLLDSFRRLRAVDLGFDPRGVTTLFASGPKGRYDTPEQAAELYRRLMDAVRAVPGVESAAVVNHVPLAGGYIPTNVVVPGRPPSPDGDDQALYKTVSEDYLRVMRARLVRGRWFTAEDMHASGDGVVINEAMARRFWPGRDPLGSPVTVYRSSQARPGFGDPEPSVVVGVVADAHHISVADAPVPEVFVPYTREVWPGIALLVRSRASSAAITPALRRAVLAVEPELPVRGSGARYGFHPLDALVAESLTDRRGETALLGTFAAVALALSALGLYGVVAFGVAQRGREFGVRMALGAGPADVRRLVVGEGARLVAVGVVVGTGAAVGLTRLLQSLLYETSPFAPVAFGGAAAALVVVALGASWGPARRAGRVDPVTTIRGES